MQPLEGSLGHGKLLAMNSIVLKHPYENGNPGVTIEQAWVKFMFAVNGKPEPI